VSPAITQIIDGVAGRLKSPLLIFVLLLNLAVLALVYYGVTDRRAKDFELVQAMMKECIAVMERRP
jgi:hypothetical protein